MAFKGKIKGGKKVRVQKQDKGTKKGSKNTKKGSKGY